MFLPSASLGHLAGSWSLVLPLRLALSVGYRKIGAVQIAAGKNPVNP